MLRILASRQLELELPTTYSPLIRVDEVGRGAPADPVAVGTHAITSNEGEAPLGLVDSKLLSVEKREEFVPQVRPWTVASVIAWVSGKEINRFGIIVGFRLAGMCALARIEEKTDASVLVLLNGSHNWLTPPEDLFTSLGGSEMPDATPGEVMMRVKAGTQCAFAATTSVIAKVARDEHMTGLEGPSYG